MLALSSGESELYAVVTASCEGFGVQAYGVDLGASLHGNVYTDSSAALGILQRTGLGRMTHLHAQALWVQETNNRGRLTYKKVKREHNPSNLQTKYLARTLINRHCEFLGLRFASGRADTAPTLNSMEGNTGRMKSFLPQALLKDLDMVNAQELQKGDYFENLEAAKKDWELDMMDVQKTRVSVEERGGDVRDDCHGEQCAECARLRWVDLDASLCCRGCSAKGSRGI